VNEKVSERKVVLAIGLPGAGKSTYFARRGIVPLSSDLIRQLLYDDAADQRRPDWVFTALRELLRRRLASGARTSYIDATNLTRRNRANGDGAALASNTETSNGETSSTKVAIADAGGAIPDSRKPRVVPEDVLRRMAREMEPPTLEEGFARIRVLRAGTGSGAARKTNRGSEKSRGGTSRDWRE
jgi:predicted kinase